MFVLPRRIAPARASRSATSLSRSGTKFSRIFEPAVVRMPRVQKLSLSEIGMPWSRLRVPPLRICRSASNAWRRARRTATVRKALRLGLSRSMRASDRSTSSTGEISFRRSRRAACSIERYISSSSECDVMRFILEPGPFHPLDLRHESSPKPSAPVGSAARGRTVRWSSKDSLRAAEVPGGTKVGNPKHDQVLVFIADRPEREFAIFKADSAARAVVAHLRDLILERTPSHIVAGSDFTVPPAAGELPIANQRADLIRALREIRRQ